MSKKLTDKQIIEKCIEIAIKNGWEMEYEVGKTSDIEVYRTDDFDGREGRLLIEPSTGFAREVEQVIFEHDFAKALFGNVVVVKNERSLVIAEETGWEFEIQMLALSEDRVDYLREFLNEHR